MRSLNSILICFTVSQSHLCVCNGSSQFGQILEQEALHGANGGGGESSN